MACANEKDEFGLCADSSCFTCKLKSIQISPYATPTRLRPQNAPKRVEPSWEKGIATDGRGMPFLDKSGEAMSIKSFGEKRSLIEEHKRKLHQAPANPS